MILFREYIKEVFNMDKQKLVKEIAKKMDITIEQVLDGINNLDIDLYETGEDAYRGVMALDNLSHTSLVDFLLDIINENVSSTSILQEWLDNYDGVVNTPFGVAYINQSFYK